MNPPKILPPHYFAIALLAIAALGAIGEPTLLPTGALLGGALAMVVGLAIAVVASRQFSSAGTNIVPFTPSTTLVTGGMFGFTRNPMYLGMLLFLGGAAAATRARWPWLPVALFYLLIRIRFVAREEMLMEQTFGAAYRAYCGRVRRWFGLRSAQASRSSTAS